MAMIGRALRLARRRINEDEWIPVWDDQATSIEGETDLQELLQSVALIVWTNLHRSSQGNPWSLSRAESAL